MLPGGTGMALDPFVQSVLDAVMGGSLHPGHPFMQVALLCVLLHAHVAHATRPAVHTVPASAASLCLGSASIDQPSCLRLPRPAYRGVSVAMPMGAVPGGRMMAPGGEQEWLDQLMSQVMAEYQPASQAASQRALRSLPTLTVRAKHAEGEPREGQAVARAGEPCSIW